MKRIIAILALAVVAVTSAYAQNAVAPEGYQMVDSIVYRPTAILDSSLVGRDIFKELSSSDAIVSVHQSDKIRSGMAQRISDNKNAAVSGFRVRIYFDNKQNARGASEEARNRFERNHPGIPAYRSFVNPFFKVTVGDFRTRSEAIELLNEISSEFPTAFVVKENINFPVVDKDNSYIIDTIRVVKPVNSL